MIINYLISLKVIKFKNIIKILKEIKNDWLIDWINK